MTAEGEAVVKAIVQARHRLLARVLADWSEADVKTLAGLSRRFVAALNGAGGQSAAAGTGV